MNPYQNPSPRQQPKRRPGPLALVRRLIYWLLIAFIVVGVTASIFGFLLFRSVSATNGLAHLFNLPEITLPGIKPPSGKPQQVAAARVPTPQPWAGRSRVTALVMGLDYRDWETGDVPRSDSMWLFTIDPASKTAGMMSIPRDMWVEIPGYGESKINMAYFYGEVNKLPGGGPALAAKTVEKFLDIKVDYTVVVDFNAFVKFIDKLDGVWIDVPEEITVDPLGPGNTVTLKPGRQKLMGAVALAYARMRYTADGDFDRMKRQMQVILAVRDRVMDPKYLPVLIAHAPDVYNLVSSGVHTDLKLQQVLQLAWMAKDVTPDRIKHATIEHSMVRDTYSTEGWEVLVPDMTQIRALRDQIFSTQVAPAPAQSLSAASTESPSPAPNPVDQMKAEGAKVIVQNGTEVSGLAKRTTDYLASLGVKMGDPADADSLFANTTIINYAGKAGTAQFLAETMHVGSGQVMSRSDPNPPADVVVIIGADWASSNPMP